MKIPEHLIKLAESCKDKAEFRHKYNSTYFLAQQNGWLDTLFPKKEVKEQENKLADKETLISLAKEFSTKKAFKDAHPYEYRRIHTLRCQKQAFEHMSNPARKWNEETCIAEARKYNRKSDFCKNSRQAYNACVRYGYMDVACAHMEK